MQPVGRGDNYKLIYGQVSPLWTGFSSLGNNLYRNNKKKTMYNLQSNVTSFFLLTRSSFHSSTLQASSSIPSLGIVESTLTPSSSLDRTLHAPGPFGIKSSES